MTTDRDGVSPERMQLRIFLGLAIVVLVVALWRVLTMWTPPAPPSRPLNLCEAYRDHLVGDSFCVTRPNGSTLLIYYGDRTISRAEAEAMARIALDGGRP